MSTENFVKNDNDFVITETLLKVDIPAGEIIDAIRSRKTTGQLTFYFIDGGVRSVMMVERSKPSIVQRVKIREILNKPQLSH